MATPDYQPMSLAHHSARDVAALIVESAPELFALMFGRRAITVLTQLVQRSQSRFSYRYIRVAVIDQRVVGMVTLVPGNAVNDATDYDAVLSLWQKTWLAIVEHGVLRFLLHHQFPADSFYIGNLAVVAAERNRGIGRQLLLNCRTEVEQGASADAPAMGAPVTRSIFTRSIFISVDVSNGKAQHLYEALGFQPVRTKAIRLLGYELGSRLLSLEI
jgi:ribosomal protein S18 acetylase RimI-like enzyme